MLLSSACTIIPSFFFFLSYRTEDSVTPSHILQRASPLTLPVTPENAFEVKKSIFDWNLNMRVYRW